MSIAAKLPPTLALALVAVVLAGCTVTGPDDTGTARDALDAGYAQAIEDYPRQLPDGYTFPEGLSGAAADRWWWCATVDAAWHAYFSDGDEDAALAYLEQVDSFDPGEFPEREIPNRLPVRYPADGSVDEGWVEGTAHQCNQWAKAAGHSLTRSA